MPTCSTCASPTTAWPNERTCLGQSSGPAEGLLVLSRAWDLPPTFNLGCEVHPERAFGALAERWPSGTAFGGHDPADLEARGDLRLPQILMRPGCVTGQVTRRPLHFLLRRNRPNAWSVPRMCLMSHEPTMPLSAMLREKVEPVERNDSFSFRKVSMKAACSRLWASEPG